MGRSFYLYTTDTSTELAVILASHQAEFDVYLSDTFTDEELEGFQDYLDELAGIWPQELIEGLTFGDLEAESSDPHRHRAFFEHCRGSLCLENVPFLENNPLQVTYLRELLGRFTQALIETEGRLLLKDEWLAETKVLKGLEKFLKPAPAHLTAKGHQVLTPVDAMVQEIYAQLARIQQHNALPDLSTLADKRQALLRAFLSGTHSTDSLLLLSTLNAKDFGDGLEGLKFYLKKIP